MTPERFQKLKKILQLRQPDLTILSEDVHKTHNISALIRTSDAVGVGEIHAVSPGGELRRHHMVEGGSRKWVKIRLHKDIGSAIKHLKQSEYHLVAAHFSNNSVDYREIDYTRPTAILLGQEQDGVSALAAEFANQHIEIPMHGMLSSLNVSVANALILYEAARQREAAGMYRESRIDPLLRDQMLFEWCYPRIATRCREKGIPYPALDEGGFLLENPLTC